MIIIRVSELPFTISKKDKIVCLFGNGVIGSQIVESIKRLSYIVQSEYFPFSWGNNSIQNDQLSIIEQYIYKYTDKSEECDVSVVWAAGKGRFGAKEDDLKPEYNDFLTTLDFIERLRNGIKSTLTFHLTSSAGGLFESQRLITPLSKPNPRRPYGDMKLWQEVELQKRSQKAGFSITLYRPSSVYGYSGGRPKGLISTVIFNTLNNKPISVFGSPHTLRDYVFDKDIGLFIAQAVLNAEPKFGTAFLTSGKPTSIQEVIRFVEGALRKKVLVNYASTLTNSANMSFNASCMPESWKPTDVKMGIKFLSRQVLSNL